MSVEKIIKWNLFPWLLLIPEEKTCIVFVVQLPSHVWLFETPWIEARRAFLTLTTSGSLPKFMSIALVMHNLKKIIEALSNSLLSKKIEYLCSNKPIFSLCIPLEHSFP